MLALLASLMLESDTIPFRLAVPPAPVLIERLRSNDTRWDATDAMHALEGLDPVPVAALERALDSTDEQQRHLAAAVLRRVRSPGVRDDGTEQPPKVAAPPSRRLLEVTVEGLRHDRLPNGRDTYTPVWNAGEGFRFLIRHAAQASDVLVAGLRSADEQQRILCALALGFGRVERAAKDAAPILIPHLRDNDIPDDAKWCTHALFGLGPGVIPLLRAAIPEADRQQESLIQLLLLDYATLPVTEEDFRVRRKMQSVTGNLNDPAFSEPLDLIVRDDWRSKR